MTIFMTKGIDPDELSALSLFTDETDDLAAIDLETPPTQSQRDGVIIMAHDWPQAAETPPEPATPEEAEAFLLKYFENERYYLGGPIPNAVLLDDRHVNMVLRLEINDCIDIFYAALEDHGDGMSVEDFAFQQRMEAKMRRSGAEQGCDTSDSDELRTSFLSSAESKKYEQVVSLRDRRHAELFFSLQEKLRKAGIPKHHSGGMMLVWLRVCRGWDI